jgi:hypothetical protein
MKTICLLYSIVDFVGMLATGYHSLVTIASFWVSLALFYVLASWSHRKRAAQKYQRKLMEAQLFVHSSKEPFR